MPPGCTGARSATTTACASLRERTPPGRCSPCRSACSPSRSACSRCADLGVHDGPIRAFTLARYPHLRRGARSARPVGRRVGRPWPRRGLTRPRRRAWLRLAMPPLEGTFAPEVAQDRSPPRGHQRRRRARSRPTRRRASRARARHRGALPAARPLKATLFFALCRRYGLKLFRAPGRRYSTGSFAPQSIPGTHPLARIRRTLRGAGCSHRPADYPRHKRGLNDDVSEAPEQNTPKRLPEANRA